MTGYKNMALKWYDPLLFKTLLPIVNSIVRLLLGTCRKVKVEGEEEALEAIASAGGKAVFAAWHQRLAYFVRHMRGKPLVVMVSQSRDGEYGASLVSLFGFSSVRGSSTRGGSEALKDLTELVIKGAWGGIVVDGPLGPPREPKIGAIVLAKKSRAPLMGVSWGADRCWVLNSWDRFLIPKPFARIVVKYTKPIFIPPYTNDKEMENYRSLLKEQLNEATAWCDEYFGVKRPWRKERKS